MNLGQEHIDRLTLHLEETEISDAAVADALRLLDDLEYGSGQLPEDWLPHCHKCDEEIAENEMMGVAFGNFYHDGCVPSLEKGPMPCGQYIGGIENYVV